jgi:hypothetical protein
LHENSDGPTRRSLRISKRSVASIPQPRQRDLSRTRKQLVREIAQHTLRIQKVLEDANLKITSVISDIMGMSGRVMMEAIIGW